MRASCVVAIAKGCAIKVMQAIVAALLSVKSTTICQGAGPAPRGVISYPPRVHATKKTFRRQKMQDKIPAISKEKQKLLFRIKRIRGQFAAVERALTSGDECADILMLLAAIRGGVNGLMAEILEDHIRLHMMNPDHAVDSPEELGEDLIGLVRAYLK